MITGAVNTDLEAVIQLTVRDGGGQSRVVDAVVDTGFNGFLTLPSALIATLGLPWLCRQEGQLADGSIQAFDVHVAIVDWDGQPRNVEVEAAETQPLIGMGLMRGSQLRIEVVPGGSVTVADLT
jgi:clan AA aspartic protease